MFYFVDTMWIIVGVVLGVACLLVVVGVVAWCVYKKRKCKKRDSKGECPYSLFITTNVRNPGRAIISFYKFGLKWLCRPGNCQSIILLMSITSNVSRMQASHTYWVLVNRTLSIRQLLRGAIFIYVICDGMHGGGIFPFFFLCYWYRVWDFEVSQSTSTVVSFIKVLHNNVSCDYCKFC